MLKKLGFHLLPKRRNQLPIECGVDTKVDEASHVRRAPIHCAALAPFFSFSFSFSSSCHSSQVCQKRRRTPATVLAFLLIQVIKITYFSLYNQFCRLHNFSMLFLFFFLCQVLVHIPLWCQCDTIANVYVILDISNQQTYLVLILCKCNQLFFLFSSSPSILFFYYVHGTLANQKFQFFFSLLCTTCINKLSTNETQSF